MKQKIILSFLVLLSSFSVAVAQRTIKGQVKESEKGEALPGVSIVLRGTNTGTITDLDGNYNIAVPEKGTAELVFSFVGYTSQTVSVGNSSTLDIVLVSDAQILNQVVVIGYESVNKRDVLGSVSSVNARQLKDNPLTNAAEALAGRLAGVQVTSTEGGPGADVVIRVRGGTSITQDNTPIYIVDGIQVENALSVVSPQDIASIDVLKDASTTAIYGARGANGVVIITTKSGKSGRTVITYNPTLGFRQISKKMDVLNPYDFVTWQYERAKLNNDTASFKNTYGSTWDTLNVYKNIEEINWQDKVFGDNAVYQTHNLGISGGTDKTTYNLSLTRNDEKGIYVNSGFVRNLVNFKFSHKASERLQMGMSIRYLNQTINGIGTSTTDSRVSNRLRHAITYRPFNNTTLEDDEFDEAYYLASSRIINPLVNANAEYRKRFTNNIVLNGNFSYEIIKGLRFSSTIGYENGAQRSDLFYSKITNYARNYAALPAALINTQNNETINNSNVLTYSKNIQKKHSFTVLTGQELYQTQVKRIGIETRFFPADITPEKALANMNLGTPPTGSTQPFSTSFVSPYNRIFSYFGRISYDYNKRFLASLSVRADRSTKFRYENGQLVFPSGSVAWRFSQEKFLKNAKWLSDGKLRVGFGTAGNNRIDDLLYLQLYAVTGQYAFNHNIQPGFAPTALANGNLRWESTKSQNIGVDLGFLDNRIQLTIDAYQNKSNNLLLAVAIPPVTGYSTQLRNVGATSNRGLEIQLNANIVKGKAFNWNSSFNMSFNRNRVESLGGITQQTRNSGWQGSDGADDYLVRVGDPIGQIYGFVTEGWYKTSDFDYNTTTKVYTLKAGVPSSASISGTIRPGALKIKDINGDGLITTDDRTIIGNAMPKFSGGWNNQFAYKGFDLSVFVNFVFGNDVYNANNIEWTDGSFSSLNTLAKVKDRYRNIDDNGNLVTAPEQLDALNVNAKTWTPVNSNRFFVKSTDIEDGSFLRLNNITLGYTLPTLVSSRIRMQQLRVFATANNLMVFTKYSGFDPEVTARNSDPLTPGVDFAAYPRAKVFVFGINASF